MPKPTTTLEHDCTGKLTKISNSEAAATEYSYDEYGRIDRVLFADGGETVLTYGDSDPNVPSNSTLITQKVSTGQEESIRTLLESDSFSNLSRVLNLNDDIEYSIYRDTRNRIETISKNTGAITKYNYDADSRPTTILDLRDGVTTITYDDAVRYRRVGEGFRVAKTTTIRNPEDDTTTLYYDILSRLIAVCVAVEVDGIEKDAYWQYWWDRRGRLEKKQNPKHRITQFFYDDLDRLRSRKTNDIVELFEYNDLHQKLNYTDPRNHMTEFKYDEYDRLTRISRPHEDFVLLTHDDRHNIDTITHNNVQVTRHHDAMDRIATFINGENQSSQYEYDLIGRLVKVINPKGYTRSKEYDSRGNVLTFTDEENNVTKMDYNGDDGLILREEPRGEITSKSYDTNKAGEVVKVYAQNDRTTEYIRDKIGRVRCIRDVQSNLSYSIDYNTFQQTKRVVFQDGAAWEYGYDEVGKLKQIKTPEGRSYNYQYDLLDRLCVAYKGNHQDLWLYTYDNNKNITSITNPLTGIITSTYDGLNRVKTISAYGRPPIAYTYNIDERRVIRKDSNGNSIVFEYDKIGNLTKVTDQEDKRFILKYDENFNVQEMHMSDSEGEYKEVYEYFPTGRLAKVCYEDGTEVAYEYDPNGNILCVTDEEGYTVRYKYEDAFDLPTCITTPDLVSIEFGYDSLGRIVKTRDSSERSTIYRDSERTVLLESKNGKVVRLSYNKDGYLERVEIYRSLSSMLLPSVPSAPATSYEYDYAGRLWRVTNTLGNTVEYHYNGLGQLEYFNINGETSQDIVEYNSDGTVKAVEDANSAKEYNYKADGLLGGVLYGDGRWKKYDYYKNGLLKKVIYSDGTAKQYAYNHAKLINSLTEDTENVTFIRDNRLRVVQEICTPGSEERTIEYYRNGMVKALGSTYYKYNERGQLDYIEIEANKIYYSYLDDGKVEKISTENGYYRNYHYDTDGRVKRIEVPGMNWHIKYDYCGNPRQVAKRDLINGDVVDEYVYDTENQLISINPKTEFAIHYQYDAAGNLIDEKEQKSGMHAVRVFDWSNQLREKYDNDELTRLFYDSKGNTIEISTGSTSIRYTYDEVNRLKSISRNGVLTERFKYDSADRLTKHKVEPEEERRIVYIGNYPSAIISRSGKTYVVADKHETRPIAFLNGEDLWHPTWVLGSSVAQHDDRGQLLGEETRRPYGDYAEGSVELNPYGFKGYYGTPNSVAWAFTRNIQPAIKHFLQPDRLRGDPIVPISMNRKRLFSNNPLRYTDFWGLQDQETEDDEYLVVVVGTRDSSPEADWPIQGMASRGGRLPTTEDMEKISAITEEAKKAGKTIYEWGKVTHPRFKRTPVVKTPAVEESPPETPSPHETPVSTSVEENFGRYLDKAIEELKRPPLMNPPPDDYGLNIGLELDFDKDYWKNWEFNLRNELFGPRWFLRYTQPRLKKLEDFSFDEYRNWAKLERQTRLQSFEPKTIMSVVGMEIQDPRDIEREKKRAMSRALNEIRSNPLSALFYLTAKYRGRDLKVQIAAADAGAALMGIAGYYAAVTVGASSIAKIPGTKTGYYETPRQSLNLTVMEDALGVTYAGRIGNRVLISDTGRAGGLQLLPPNFGPFYRTDTPVLPY